MKTVNNTQQLFGSEVASSKGEAQSRSLFENVKPHLVEEQTLFEAEQVWKKRLGMLVAAENNLIKVIRLRKITGIFTVASIAVFLFSLYVAPTMPPIVFFGLIALAAFGFATYPAWFFASKSNKKQRDAISRLFFMSNHEVEVADGKVTLINRANYSSVTEIHVMDRKLGQFANS
ncbi:hypothetical protein [Alteromonas sp. S167]|uniref:hypothetical protein n=1 Tax=Alteromonas sp. S167 TaxID=3117402 RepID=UPI002FDF0D6E